MCSSLKGEDIPITLEKTSLKGEDSPVITEQVPIAAEQISQDVPQKSKEEVERRGDMIQQMGTAQAGEEDYIADALDPPEKDDDKWWITLVVNGTEHKPSERLKYDLIHDKILKSWVNVEEPAKSFTHYQVRDIALGTQDHWFDGIKTYIEAGKENPDTFPLVVIQPPENGKFGKPEFIVGVVIGYDGNVKKLVTNIRNKIKFYIRKMLDEGVISVTSSVGENTNRGFAQSSPVARPREGSYETPFAAPKKLYDPVQPNPKYDFPSLEDMHDETLVKNKPLTLAEMKVIAPTATDEFLMSQLMLNVTQDQFLVNWNQHNLPTKKDDTSDFQGAPQWLMIIMLSLVSAGMLVLLWRMNQATQKTNETLTKYFRTDSTSGN